MLDTEPSHLFVYGTLRPGLAPPLIAEVVGRTSVVGAATVCGKLYHLGAYPGCKLEEEGGDVIHGMVLTIPDAATLARLDWYEDYVASDAAGSLFVRRRAVARLEGGGEMAVWVYEYNRSVFTARLIASGRYDRGHEEE